MSKTTKKSKSVEFTKTKSYKQVHDAQLNGSPSKAQYSFPKASRFEPVKLSGKWKKQYYNVKPTKNSRAAGFGFGRRSDFTRQRDMVPSPDAYQSDKGIGNHSKWSFGIAREALNAVVETHMQSDPAVPGPGKYKIKSGLANKVSYSFRPQTKELSQQPNKNPGPGSYAKVHGLDPKGRYSSSRLKSPAGTAFGRMSSNRFYAYDPKIPGPGSYKPKTELINSAESHVSKLPKTLGGRFPIAYREQVPIPKLSTPGPGSYIAHSDFGSCEPSLKRVSSQRVISRNKLC